MPVIPSYSPYRTRRVPRRRSLDLGTASAAVRRLAAAGWRRRRRRRVHEGPQQHTQPSGLLLAVRVRSRSVRPVCRPRRSTRSRRGGRAPRPGACDDRLSGTVAHASHRAAHWSHVPRRPLVRRDLRLADNPALLRAVADPDEVVPLFVVDPRCSSVGRRTRCVHARLPGLTGRLDGPRARVPPRDPLGRSCASPRRSAPQTSTCEGLRPVRRRRDARWPRRWQRRTSASTVSGSPYAVDPGTVRKGRRHAVRRVHAVLQGLAGGGLGHAAPRAGRRALARCAAVHCDGPQPRPEPGCDLPARREDAAQTGCGSLRRRRRDGLDGYDDRRNDPARSGTSRLSPGTALGSRAPAPAARRPAALPRTTCFRSEIAWREFYADVPVPPTRHGAGEPEPQDGRVAGRQQTTPRGIGSPPGCEGRTAIRSSTPGCASCSPPAGCTTGAMITASFLVKDLHLPWAVGCPVLHAAPRRRRPGQQSARLAVDGRDGHGRGAVLPGLQPRRAGRTLRPERRLRAALVPELAEPPGGTDPCPVDQGVPLG